LHLTTKYINVFVYDSMPCPEADPGIVQVAAEPRVGKRNPQGRSWSILNFLLS